MLVDKADIETLEFIEWSSVEAYLREQHKEPQP
jgi:hypothetical protein